MTMVIAILRNITSPICLWHLPAPKEMEEPRAEFLADVGLGKFLNTSRIELCAVDCFIEQFDY
jgi:hypothetical protein